MLFLEGTVWAQREAAKWHQIKELLIWRFECNIGKCSRDWVRLGFKGIESGPIKKVDRKYRMR
jgi:hypothetical protein